MGEIPRDFGSLRDLLSDACKKHGELTAFSCESAQITFSELEKKSNEFAAWLQCETTLEPGDRVAIQVPNLIQYPVVALGAIKAGMVIVNINPLYTAGETEHQLRDSGARVLVTMEEILPVTSRILPGTEIEKVVITRAADLHPLPWRWAYKVSRAAMIRRAKAIRFSGKVSLKTVLAKGRLQIKDRGLGKNHSGQREQLALIQYTGGTTGVAKGAMLSHDNLIANMHQIDHVIEGHCRDPGSVAAAPLPFYHIYAFTLNFLYSICKGYHGILIPDPRKTEKVIKALKPHRISSFVGISTLFHMLCKDRKFHQLDFSSLKVCTSGGMALSVATARRWEKITGCRILEGYGLTETSPLVASNTLDSFQEGKISSTTQWTEIKVVDETGKEVPPGEEGEILVRGPQVMLGYWNRPEETSAVLKDNGWLHTGDIGVIDEDGSLSVVDRIKDLIIVSGFNVYPAEIESHVHKHPDIREAAAIGVPRGEGESVKLFVISENPELTEEEVIHFCRQGLTPYKVPAKVEFRATLPRSNVGKILRRQLREDQAS